MRNKGTSNKIMFLNYRKATWFLIIESKYGWMLVEKWMNQPDNLYSLDPLADLALLILEKISTRKLFQLPGITFGATAVFSFLFSLGSATNKFLLVFYCLVIKHKLNMKCHKLNWG